MRRAKIWHLALLALIAALALSGAFQGLEPRAIPPHSDYWDYLQLGRQLHAGQGFSSLFTYPLFLKASGTGPLFPLLWRPPLFPLLVGLVFFLAGGPTVWAPLLLQVIGYLLAVFAAYRLALEFVDAGWALLAGVVVALSPGVMGLHEPGITTALYTAGLTLGFLLGVRAEGRRRAALLGACFGALALFRSETVLLIPAVMWLLWAGDRGDRERRIWIFLGVGFAVTVPWILRNWLVTGRPFFAGSSLLYVDTVAFPGWESSRRLETLDRSALLWGLRNPGIMAYKTARNFYHFLGQALLLPLPALAPFVWAASGRLSRVGKESAYCAAVLIGIGFFMFFLAPLEYAPRFLHPFIPLLTVVSVIMLDRIREVLTDKGRQQVLTRRPAVWVAGAVVTLAALEFIGAVHTVRHERAVTDRTLAAVSPAVWTGVAGRFEAGQWGMADYPAYYAWQTGRRFVWVPVLPELNRVATSASGRRGVLLARGRGVGTPDPTGILPTPALAETLAARGWTVEEMGPLLVVTGRP